MGDLVRRLKDADIKRLALCKMGANRQRIFLLKSSEGDESVAAVAQIVKEPGDSWRTAYVPVAVPGAEEDQGMLGDPMGSDVWDSDEEIRRAAHRFMANGAQIVAKHFDAEAAEGVRLVENAVALSDFSVGDTTIKEGTWYVGLEFDEPLRSQVISGEIDAVSVEGLATVAKTHSGEKRGGSIENLIRYYMRFPHPFTKCVRDNRKRFGPRAEAVCAGLKDLATGHHNWRKGGQALAKSADAEQEFIAKQVDEWQNRGLTGADAEAALDMLREMDENEKKGLVHSIAKALGLRPEEVPGGENTEIAKESDTVGSNEEDLMDEQIKSRFEELEEKVNAQGDQLSTIAKSTEGLSELPAQIEALAKRLPEPEEDPAKVAEQLTSEVAEVAKSVEGLAERVAKLAEGDSVQEERETVAKSKDEDPLAGILS